MALNDIKVPKENAQGTFDEVSLTPAEISAVPTSRSISAGTGLTGGGDLTANRTLAVAYGTTSGTACQGNDARLSDSRTPTAHKNSHAVGQSDALAPSDIGAQSIFVSEQLTLTTTAQVTLTAARAKVLTIVQYAGGNVDIVMPQSGFLDGDVFVFKWGTGSDSVVVRPVSAGSPITTISAGEQKRVQRVNPGGWVEVPVDTHTHPASAITSGTLDIARIPTGTGSTQVSLGNHAHGNINSSGQIGSTAGLPVVTTTAGAVTTLALGTANQILRVNSGASGVEFADPAASGVTGAASSASDVLGVSGANITGVDAGSADRLVFWDDSANKLTYLQAGSGLSISGTTLSASGSNMTGATSNAAGAAGLVPQPAAGDEEKVLTGAGTFHFPSLPIVKTQTTRGTTTSRWILPPFAQDAAAGSSGGADNEFCGGYVYVPYTGSYYFATIPAAAYSGSVLTSWALYNLAADGLPGTLAVTLGQLNVGAGSGVLCESATSVSLTKGWYCCVHRCNGNFNLWSPQSHHWLNYTVGHITNNLTGGASGKRRFYRSLVYSTSFASDLTTTNWTEDGFTPPCCYIRRA